MAILCAVREGAVKSSCAMCTRAFEIVIDWKLVIYVDEKRSIYYTCECGEKYLIHINERTSPRSACKDEATLSWLGGKVGVIVIDRSHGGMRCKMNGRLSKTVKIGDVVQVGDDRLFIKTISQEYVGLQYIDRKNLSPQQRGIVRMRHRSAAA